ncbi:hypothetical protein LTR15_010389 [Elasticomyces elasticus]|nr:hypothetical protein LTR15_010389 [Elasticomyces elasticus]
MLSPLQHWWRRDSALHSFVYANFLIGLPFTIFNTYVIYQLQIVGFLLGTDSYEKQADGQPCTTYCIVPWAGTDMDLNSIILYLNAIGFGIGGAVTLLLSAYSDYWSRKHLLVTISIAVYGACSIPCYWLQGYTLNSFDALTALWILFAVLTFIIMAVLSMYIPHCMRNVATNQSTLDTEGSKQHARRKYGVTMTIFGQISNQIGSVLLLVVVMILTQTLTGTAATSAGLLVTSTVGFITVAGSLGALWGLPAVPARHWSSGAAWYEPVVELVRPLQDLVRRKNMAFLLIAYTIYVDTLFAVSSVAGQLFVAEIRPGALEYSLYSLAQVLCIIGCQAMFLWIRPHLPFSLEKWLIAGYATSLILPVWGLIGFASVRFGWKTRWEFYVVTFISQLSQAFANTAWKVLFSELIPVGSEVRWLTLQVVLSCGTVWVNYVASAPLQNATHELRFPLIISLVFLCFPVVMELARCNLRVFREDKEKWEPAEFEDDQGSQSEEGSQALQGTIVVDGHMKR